MTEFARTPVAAHNILAFDEAVCQHWFSQAQSHLLSFSPVASLDALSMRMQKIAHTLHDIAPSSPPAAATTASSIDSSATHYPFGFTNAASPQVHRPATIRFSVNQSHHLTLSSSNIQHEVRGGARNPAASAQQPSPLGDVLKPAFNTAATTKVIVLSAMATGGRTAAASIVVHTSRTAFQLRLSAGHFCCWFFALQPVTYAMQSCPLLLAKFEQCETQGGEINCESLTVCTQQQLRQLRQQLQSAAEPATAL
jgi:hypothetical protein